MKIKFNEVTWYSWLLTGVIFLIIIPLLAFHFVGQYKEVTSINSTYVVTRPAPAYSNATSTTKLLSYHYKIENNQVFYKNWSSKGENWLAISGADPKTFQVVFDENNYSISYAKDANYVFVNKSFNDANTNEIIKDADPKTFKISDNVSLPGVEKVPAYLGHATLAQDNSHVFMCWGAVTVDLSKFKFLGNMFATDGSVVYNLHRYCEVLQNIDPASFKQFANDDSVYKDKNNVYAHFDGVEISETDRLNVDVGSFEYLTYGFAKDNQHVYTIDLPPDAKIVEGISSDGFEYLGSFYFKNNQKVYRVIYHGCMKDNCSYYDLNEVVGADPASFQLVGVDKGGENDDLSQLYSEMASTSTTTIDAKDKIHSYSNGVAL